jgi:hypothetical protein
VGFKPWAVAKPQNLPKNLELKFLAPVVPSSGGVSWQDLPGGTKTVLVRFWGWGPMQSYRVGGTRLLSPSLPFFDFHPGQRSKAQVPQASALAGMQGRRRLGVTNLSPRTIDAQVRLRSGCDNRGTFTPRAWGQLKPKNNRESGGGGQQIAYI